MKGVIITPILALFLGLLVGGPIAAAVAFFAVVVVEVVVIKQMVTHRGQQ